MLLEAHLGKRPMDNKAINELLQLSSIVQDSDDAIISRTLDGTIISWNKAAERMYGYTEEEILGSHINRLIPTDRIHEEDAILRRITNGGKVNHFETTRVAKDGSRISISLTVSPIKDNQGVVIGASKIARDISRQKLFEEKQNWLASIIDSSMDAIISKTLDGIIVSWNNAAEKLFGYQRHEAIGRHISFLFPPDRLDEEDMILGRIRNGLAVDHFETIRLAKDGREIAISLTISPIKDEKGNILGASKIARDITTQLEEKKKLNFYYKQLEQMNSYKDEFIGMASHELKTPLTSISAYLQLLERNPDQTTNKRFIKKATAQVSKLTRLVSDLLDISKIQSGKLSLNYTDFDFDDLLDETLDVFDQISHSHRFEIKNRTRARLYADQQRIEQVLINLLTNSTKYSPTADKVEIETVLTDKELIVSVKDHGIGIPEDQQQRIFNRFYRAEGLPLSYSGLGISLYISNEIVCRHGGRMWVKSKPQEGSTFFFTLPLNYPNPE